MTLVPKEVFFTKGHGKHKNKLQSFELALRDAGIQQCNLVCVSSILPPGCKMISRQKGLAKLKPGEITFVVMARNETNEPNRLVSASIGAAIPADKGAYGYLSEHHSFGETEKKCGDYAEDLAASMLGSTLGVNVDPEKAWDEKKETFKISDKIVRTMNTTQSALGEKNGLWTSVVSAAVFIMEYENRA